jgi:hypothetical protein
MQKKGAGTGNYVLAITTESGPTGQKKPGAINGGFFEKKPNSPMQYSSVVISVDDIKQAIKKVGNAGGAARRDGNAPTPRAPDLHYGQHGERGPKPTHYQPPDWAGESSIRIGERDPAARDCHSEEE